MNLQFTNKGGNFVSEFEVTSDFNLHIEGVRLSDMHIYQKTAGGSYAKVTDFPSERSQDRVADFDFASLVYPKFIKVVCATEPTYAEIATDGEVTEIKSQSKEVEITANGVTEIAPDAGFGYLSGVKVNVNVPTGGGDTPSQPSGGGALEYLDVSGIDGRKKQILIMVCAIARAGVSIVPPLMFIGEGISLNDIVSYTSMCGIDFETPVHYSSTVFSIKELLTMNAFTETELNAIPRVTKEQFYTI